MKSAQKARICSEAVPALDIHYATFAPLRTTIRMGNVTAPPAHGTVLAGPANGQTKLAYRPLPSFTGLMNFKIKFYDVVNARELP
jgi:hypothetical protein